MRRLRPRLPRLLRAAVLAALFAPQIKAAPRTFTSQDGRTMEAEIVSYKGDTLRVRRADTGREFTLALSGLAPADQEALRKFIADHPELRETIPASALRVEYSKARADTERANGTYYDVTVENWGYSFTLVNLTNTPLEGLRIDYLVFAERDPDGSYSNTRPAQQTLERKRGSLVFDPVPVHGKITLRTETIACRTEKLEGGARWITNDGTKSRLRDKVIHGVWFRLYDGEKLIQEGSSPESLRTTERWGKTESQ